MPANVRVGGAEPPLVIAPVLRSDAPAQIEWIWFNSLDVARGHRWSGKIETSSNVASVEVRSNLFSITANRVNFGRFRFATDVVDVPSIFIRRYNVRVIARNAAGAEAEVDVPFRIR